MATPWTTPWTTGVLEFAFGTSSVSLGAEAPNDGGEEILSEPADEGSPARGEVKVREGSFTGCAERDHRFSNGQRGSGESTEAAPVMEPTDAPSAFLP